MAEELVHENNVELLLEFLLGLPRPEPAEYLDDDVEGAYDYDLGEEEAQ